MIISVCSHCKASKTLNLNQEQILDQLTSGLCENIEVQQVKCLAACNHPIAVGISEQSKASYLFGHISSHDDVNALIEFVGQYKTRETGWTNATERPKALLKKTIARIPASPLVDQVKDKEYVSTN